MASATGTLYIGMTNNLLRRVEEHRECKIEGFTKKYSCTKLIYYECVQYVNNAISREKQLKNWNRKKKQDLIATINPHWKDLYSELFDG